jgi:hypothetical protein
MAEPVRQRCGAPAREHLGRDVDEQLYDLAA